MGRRWSRAEEEFVASMVDLCAGTSRQLKRVHSHVLINGQSQNNFIAAKLVRAFAELGNLEHARAIADDLCNPNIFVWTALIRGYSSLTGSGNSATLEGFLLYKRLQQFYPLLRPLSFTLSSVLKVCAHLQALVEGIQVHSHAFKNGFQLDSRVQTSLMHLYGKCCCLRDARQVFDELFARGELDLQAWNTMLDIYAEAGEMEAALYLFVRMPEYNTHTYIAMIHGYTVLGKIELARELVAAHLPPNEKNSVVSTALIAGYAQCGDLSASRRMFDELEDGDVASWNAMIAAYARAGRVEEAVDVFQMMMDGDRGRNAQPNHTTISTIASACAQSGSPSRSRSLQAYVDGRGSELLNRHTVAALIDMHSKCGDLRSAYDLFSRFKPKDLVCYSTMIAGFGIHGRGEDAIRLFEELQEVNSKPDAICFVSLLAACSHSGKVEEGKRYFELMRNKYGIHPTAEHYMCLVDLLGRAGLVEEAYRLVTDDMGMVARPHAMAWGALLSACRSYSRVEIGEVAAGCLIEMEPENLGNYVLLSNIYAKAQMWSDVARVRAAMRRKGIRKPPGWSSVEIMEGRSRKFITGEGYDSELELVVQVLSWELKVQGYLSNMDEIDEAE
ncbi:putative pentatricopeptide repeat-containing protein [Platanthera zijinensis]|uniref:Pentatricopeptide repeat-containing protein n=1 Tax=Platanthera zijinensis TaxID=2320716 RepID=A0AAP0FU79_9ASPA